MIIPSPGFWGLSPEPSGALANCLNFCSLLLRFTVLSLAVGRGVSNTGRPVLEMAVNMLKCSFPLAASLHIPICWVPEDNSVCMHTFLLPYTSFKHPAGSIKVTIIFSQAWRNTKYSQRNYFIGSANSLAFLLFCLKIFFKERESFRWYWQFEKDLGSLKLSFLWILDRKDEILLILFIVLNHWCSCQSYNNSGNSKQRERGRKRRKGRDRRKNSNRDVCRGQCRASWPQGRVWYNSSFELSSIYSFPVTLTPSPPTSLHWWYEAFFTAGWSRVREE